jgi:hypothetical protein
VPIGPTVAQATPAAQLLVPGFLVLATVAGVAVGASIGALGAGGSLLTVPILVYVLDQNPYAATTGSLIIVGLAALAGLATHAGYGQVRWRTGLSFGALGLVGSVIGAALSAKVSPQALLAAFAVLMLVAALLMLRSQPSPHSRAAQDRPKSFVLVAGAATVVGALTGFFGVGGGFLVVPALATVVGLGMREAIGTSLVVISINAAAALATRLSDAPQLNWAMLATFTAAAALTAVIAGRLTRHIAPRYLSLAFASLLVAVALYTAAHSLGLIAG